MKSKGIVTFLITCCMCNTVFADERKCNRGEIKPAHLYVLEKEAITLTCVQNVFKPSNLSFIQKNEIVDLKYIKKLNSTAIEMKFPLTGEYMNTLTGISVNFLCMDVDSMICIQSIYVDVDYFPVVPLNITCRMYYWEKIICSWSLGVKYKYPENINVIAEYINDDSLEPHVQLGSTDWRKCDKYTNKTGCIWEGNNFQPCWRMFLRVTVNNTKRNITVMTHNVSFILDEINEPAAIDPATIRVKVYNDSRLRVRWRPYSVAKQLIFKLTFASPCTGSKTTFVDFKPMRKKSKISIRKHVSYIICDLKAHSNYTVSISGRYKPKEEPVGYWSEPKGINYTTIDKVPAKSPDTIDGLYDHVFHTHGNFTIYWKPLDTCELNSGSLEYVVSSDINTEVLGHPLFSTQLKTHNLPVNVTIRARNNVGNASTTSFITVFPESMAPTPSELIVGHAVTAGKSRVTLTIKEAKQENNNIHSISHVLVSCKRQYSCLEHAHWEVIHQSTIDRTVTDFTRFGLITRGYLKDQPVHTGIIWQKCGYHIGQRPSKPVLEHIMPETQPEGGFRIDWLPQDCSKDHTGYIQNYQVIYCDLTLDNACKTPYVVNVSKDETSYTNTELHTGDEYNVSLVAVGVNGMNSTSEPVTLTINRPTSNRWMYAILIGIVILIALTVFVFMFKRCKNRLESKAHVTVPPLDDLAPKTVNCQKTGFPSIKRRSLSSDIHKDVCNPCTDSGTSSLISNGTEDSQVTERLLTNCDSDSVLNLNTTQHDQKQDESEEERLPLNCINAVSSTDSHEKLPHYHQAESLSVGCNIMYEIYGKLDPVCDENDKLSEIETELDENNETGSIEMQPEEATQQTSEDRGDKSSDNGLQGYGIYGPRTSGCAENEPKVIAVNEKMNESLEKDYPEGLNSESQTTLSHGCRGEEKKVQVHFNTLTSPVSNDAIITRNEQHSSLSIKCEDSFKNISDELSETDSASRLAEEPPTGILQFSCDSIDPLDGYGRGLDMELDSGDTIKSIDLENGESNVEETICDNIDPCDLVAGPVLAVTDQSLQHKSFTDFEITARTTDDVSDTGEFVEQSFKCDKIIKEVDESRVVQDPEHPSGDYHKVTLNSSGTTGTAGELNVNIG